MPQLIDIRTRSVSLMVSFRSKNATKFKSWSGLKCNKSVTTRSGFGVLISFRISTNHYDDAIMGAMASQITRLMIPGEFPAQMASNAENVSIWWRHHAFLQRFCETAWQRSRWYKIRNASNTVCSLFCFVVVWYWLVLSISTAVTSLVFELWYDFKQSWTRREWITWNY